MLRRPKLRWIAADEPLPAAQSALREPDGLVAAGSDLSADRLFEAYCKGIFPWYSDGQPVLWWSPDPRMVLLVDDFAPSKSLQKRMRQLRNTGDWSVSMDRAFDRVMHECAQARPGQNGTWISAAIIQSYVELHRRGFAHSVEVWHADELIGGLYGVSIGKMFFGESMFARRSDASKIALAVLMKALQQHGFHMVDCQQDTAHLASLGARTMTRAEFLDKLHHLVSLPGPDWQQIRQCELLGVS
jgi:leucyl/phenylalanyl-tRNA---protein transferase